MPTSRPMLFSESMIKAILSGKKTQTRRIVKRQPRGHHWEMLPTHALRSDLKMCSDGLHVRFAHSHKTHGHYSEDDPLWVKCPYGSVGDTLWCREAWQLPARWDDNSGGDLLGTFGLEAVQSFPIRYESDLVTRNVKTEDLVWGRYRHARFMPRWASRISLEIKNIRVERLNDISEEDAVAEGIQAFTKDGTLMKYWACDPCDGPFKNEWSKLPRTAKEAYAALWEKINGKGSREANPFVWVVEFSRVAALPAGEGE